MAGSNEQLCAAQSRNRDVKNKVADAQQDCSDIVNISIFFDGTGNNDIADTVDSKWSNPSRLFHSAARMMGHKNNNFAFYISGVGTKYNGKPTAWTKAEDGFMGMGVGNGGTRRTEMGKGNMNDALRQALLDKAVTLNAMTAEDVKNSSAAKLSDIKKTLDKYKLVSVINLSVFGFSRGAALARAFVNDFLRNQCIQEKSGPHFQGYPVTFKFLGLFDTVASFGLPSMNIDTPFSEKNLVVPNVVERCVHLVAAHEIRFSFPVDIIRKGGKYQPNWTEEVYPGVHSDVGGGYAPVVQGRSNNYSRIPMRRMLHEAWMSGVRLFNYAQLPDELGDGTFKEMYEVSDKTAERFTKYMAAVNAPRNIEGAVNAHMKALYSAFGTMTRKKMLTPDLVEGQGSVGAFLIGHDGIAEEADMLLGPNKGVIATARHAISELGNPVHQVAGRVYTQIVRPELWRLQAWQQNCPADVMTFVGTAVHDSKAGFLCSIEPFSYFRPRGMAESSRNVLASGLDWLDETGAKIRLGTYKIIHRAGAVIVETWEEGVLVTTTKYQEGKKFTLQKAREGWTYTVEVAQEAKNVSVWALKTASDWVITSSVAAGKKVGEYADERKKDLGEFADTTKKNIGEYADARQKDLSEFADGVQTKAGEVGRSIQSGAGRAVDIGVSAVENTWTNAKSAFGL